MKCFYHNDNDGKAAAFCVHAWVGIHDFINSMFRMPEFIEMNYTKPFPLNTIQKDEQIWIVDYHIEPEEMDALLKITKDVTWIDHHISAIEKFKNYPNEIRGIREVGTAACELAWKYIHWYTARGDGNIKIKENKIKGLEVPKFIKLIGDWDIWKFQYPETRIFNAASKLYDLSSYSNFWLNLMDLELEPIKGTGNANALKRAKEFWNKLIEQGKTVIEYEKIKNKNDVDNFSFIVHFEGYKCLAMNMVRGNCDAMGGVAQYKNYDILMPFYFNGKDDKWIVNMYSEKVDVSKIAMKYGGGGHKGAAGYTCTDLPTWLQLL